MSSRGSGDALRFASAYTLRHLLLVHALTSHILLRLFFPSLIDTVHGLFNGGASKGYATGGAALPECPQQQPVNSEREGASWPPVFVAHGFSSVPLIKVRLNDVDAHRVLTTAPSVEARTAWLNGIHLPNSPRRLHLVVKESMGWLVAPPMQDSSSEIWAKLHDEGRRWWRGEADE